MSDDFVDDSVSGDGLSTDELIDPATYLAVLDVESGLVLDGICQGYEEAQVRAESPELSNQLPERLSVRDVIQTVEQIECEFYSADDLVNLGRAFQTTFDYAGSLLLDPSPDHPSLGDCVLWLQQLVKHRLSDHLLWLITAAFWKCDFGTIPQITALRRRIDRANAEARRRQDAQSIQRPPQSSSVAAFLTDWY